MIPPSFYEPIPPHFYGVPVHVEPRRARYVLPDDVPPPPGMTRDEFLKWSLRVCGYQAPILADGQVFKTPDGLHMNAATWAKVQEALAAERKVGAA